MNKGELIHVIQMLYLLVYDTYITASNAMNNIDESLNFRGVIVGNKPVFKFTCESVQRPIGDAVSIQVNLTTVDVIRNSNNKCYDIHNECRADTCLCYYDGVKFKMEYWYEVLDSSESFNFGVEMILKDTNSNIVVVTLSRFYNGKDFEKLEIVKETNQYKFMENIVPLGNNLESGASHEGILKVVSAGLTLSLIVIVSVLCIHRYCKRTWVQESEELKPCLSDTTTINEAADEDRKSVFDLLVADNEPKDKSFDFSAVNKSFSKSNIDEDTEDTGHSFVTGRMVSEGQTKIKSGMKPPPGFRECPKDIIIQSPVLVQEKEGAYQSVISSCTKEKLESVPDVFEGRKMLTSYIATKEQCLSNESSHEDRGSVIDVLVADDEPPKDKASGYSQEYKSLGRKMQSFGKRMRYFDNQNEFNQSIDAGRTDSEGKHDITSGMEQPHVFCRYAEDETIQSSVLVQERENVYQSISRCSIEQLATEPKQFTLNIATKEQCISNKSAHEDRESVIDLLDADYEPAKDKSFVFNQVNKSLSKSMQNKNNIKEINQWIDLRRTYSEGQINIEQPPVSFHYPDDKTIQSPIHVQERENVHQSSSVSFHQIDKDYDTEEVSSDFDEIESDHLFEFLDEDNISEDDKSEFRNTADSIPFEDIESEEDSSDFEEIDFEETVNTGLIDKLSSEHDESDGMQPCNTSTSEQSMSKESAHVDRDYAINILKIDDESLVFRQLNKSLSKRMQYSDTIEEADQSVGGRRDHSNGKIEIGPPPDFCEDYQVETLQISVYDGKGFHLSCSYERFEDDNGDLFSDSEVKKIVEKETEYTPSLTKNHENKEKALLVIGATEIGNSRFVRSLDNLLMRGSYSKDCQSTIICKTANEQQLEFNTTANTVNGAPTIYFIVNAISILGSMETHAKAIPYNTLKDFDKRIELLLHSTICRSFRYHICSCVNRQDSKLGDDVLQHFFLNLKHRKPNLMIQHG